MPIQVYERFDHTDQKTERGDLWETITWDFAAPSWRTGASAGWLLRSDFRMPAHGILRFMHPIKDDAIEFSYDTPALNIPNYTPGVIKQSSFTEELKKQWEALPKEWSCQIGKMTLTCTKDIVDAIESNIMGELYLYRPAELRIN